MKPSKLRATVLQATAVLLFFALAFGATAASAGLFDQREPGEQGADSPFDQLFRPNQQTTVPDQNAPNTPADPNRPDDPNDPTIKADYVQNLNNAFNTNLIEGYTADRASVSLSRRLELYERLTAAIATVDSGVTPVTYADYNGSTYTLVKRLKLDGDYTTGTEIVTKYTKQYSNKDASYKIVATPYLVGRKTVQSYMGYLIVSRIELRQVEIVIPPATTVPPVTEEGTVPSVPVVPPVTQAPVTDPFQTDEILPPATQIPSTTAPITVPSTNAPITVPSTHVPSTTAPSTTPATTTEAIVPTPSEEERTPVTAGSAADPTLPTPEVTEPSAPSRASAAPEERENTEQDPTVRYETVEVNVLSLYDRNGNLLIDDLGTKEPYFARDYSNYPVFKDAEGKLFAFDGKKFIATDKGKLRSELFYDYPANPLGVYKGIYEAHYNASKGGYNYINYKNGGSVVSANFFKAYNFGSEGYAVIVTETDNFLQIINRSKSQIFKPGKQYTYYTDPVSGKKQYVKDFYAFPDTSGIESIGCTGFDNGYLRLRIKTSSMMSDSLGKIVVDDFYLFNTKGEQFDIPEGYSLEGYSDGILLLRSKEGLYGYYSIQGDWIAQPIYTYARPFIQGLAVLGSETGTVGMIDTKGNIVLPFVYTSIEDVSSGLIVTYCEGVGYETYELVKK